MASNNIARLGVVLGIDTAVFSADIDKAISENRRFGREMKRGSEAAMQEALNLKYATEDYGKEVSRLAQVERQLATGRMSMAHDTVKQALRDQAKAYDDAVAAAKRLQQAQAIDKDVQALKYATEDYGKTLTKVQIIEREIANGKYRTATDDQKKRLLDQARAYDAVAVSAQKVVNVQGKLTDQQRMALSYQTTDIVTSLVSGQNPFMVLMQQGGQLKDQFGGVGNVFRAIGQTLTPMRLLIGGVATAFGALAIAAYKGADESSKLRDSLILTGNYANISAGQYRDLALSISNDYNVAIGDTKDILNAVISSGKFTDTSLSSVARAISIIAKISGESASQVASKLIPSLDGSASSAKRLNDQYNFLTLAQYKQIEALEKQGKLQDAIRIKADALTAAKVSQRRELGVLERSWEALKKAASDTWDAMLGLGRKESTEAGLKRVSEALKLNTEDLEIQKKNPVATAILMEERMRLLAEQSSLQEIERMRKASASKSAEERGKIDLYANAGGLSTQRSIDDAVAKQRLENFKTQQSLMADAEVLAFAESNSKIEAARLERDKKNRDQNSVFAAQNEAEYHQTVIASRLGLSQKLMEIQQKRDLMGLDLRKQQIEQEFNIRFNQETEIGKVEAERDKKIALARLNLQKKNIEERNLYAKENDTALAAEIVGIEADANRQIESIRLNRFINLQNAVQEFRDETDRDRASASAAEMQAAQALASEIDQKFLSVAQDRASLQIQMDMVNLSEKDRNLALNRLQTEQEIAAIKRNQNLTETDKQAAIERVKNLGLQRDNLILMQEEMKKVGEVNNAIFGNMEKALENFVRTGKFSFKDFARSVIQDLIMIQLKSAATSILRTIIGAATGNPMMMLPSSTGQYGVGPTGFANGGDPQPHRAALVGERGPELFVPQTAGTIIPNNALGSLGGTQIINNYNIQAIDVKSFEDRIMGSNKAVWAANSYANKSLAIGRGRA
jgi:hypothetical protein